MQSCVAVLFDKSIILFMYIVLTCCSARVVEALFDWSG